MLDAQAIEKTVTKVKLSDIHEGNIFSVHDKPNLKYAWDNGVSIGRYLAELHHLGESLILGHSA